MNLWETDKRILEKIYHNSFVRMPPDSAKVAASKSGVDMIFNSYGFRSPEFKKDIDFLFSGCSVTEGWGVSKNNIWFEKISADIDCSYSSVAKAGDSINGQVRKIFAYIKKFGNPKNIVCVFPDFNRVQIFNNKDLFASKPFFNAYDEKILQQKINAIGNEQNTNFYLNSLYTDASVARVSEEQNEKEFFKRPLNAEEVIPLEMAHLYSAQSINILSQYCNAAGINFIWGTWNPNDAEFVQKMRYDGFFDEYVDLHEDEKWVYDYHLKIDLLKIDNQIAKCHSEYEHDPEFHLGLDIHNGRHNAHFGSHRHIHYYEKIKNQIEINQNDKN